MSFLNIVGSRYCWGREIQYMAIEGKGGWEEGNSVWRALKGHIRDIGFFLEGAIFTQIGDLKSVLRNSVPKHELSILLSLSLQL